MADLKDTLQLDVTQYLKQLDTVDKKIGDLYRPRPAPPLPPVPPLPNGGGAGGGNRGGQSAAQKELTELANRLKVAQNEIRQLGAAATPAQLTAYAQQLATITTRAQALGPGLAAGSREARNLSGLLLGLQGTSGQVNAALNALAQGPRPVNDPAFLRQLRLEITSVNNQIATARNNFIQLDGAATPRQIRDLVRTMTDLKTKANDLARGLPAGSEELRRLSLAAATAERSIAGATGQMSRLGLASQVRLGTTASLNDFRGQFQSVTSGIQNFARFTDTARLASALFESQLRRQNLSFDQGSKAVTTLSDRLKILPSQAQDAIQVLLRNGFDLNQAVDVLSRAGASAISRGRTAADGVDLFSQAIQSQSSTMLNYIGIAGNLSDFYVQYGKQIGKTSNTLNQQEKAQAAVNLVTKETNEELANLPLLQASLSGGFSDLSISYQNFQKTIGKSFVGPTADFVAGLNSSISYFQKLPTAVQDGIGKIVLMGAATLVLGKLLLFGVQNVYAFKTQILGIAPAAAGANGGLSLFGVGIGIFRKTLAGAAAEIGAFKLAVTGVGAALAVGFTGYSIGRQIGELDTDKGTVDQNIQFDILKRDRSLQKILGISPSEADAAADQLARDLDGITAKAEKQYEEARVKGGTLYASYIRAAGNARELRSSATARYNTALETGDTAGEEAAKRQIDLLNQQIRKIDQAAAALLKKKAVAKADEASTVAQDEAYDKLKGTLADLGQQFGAVKTTEFQGQLVAAQKAFETFQGNITKAMKSGDITAKQGAALREQFKTATASIVPNLVQRQLDSNKEAALTGQRDLEATRIALIRDARSKRESELTLETERIRDEYKKRIDEANQNAGARGLSTDQGKALAAEAVRLEGERDEKIRLAREGANRELETLERESQGKVLDAQRASLQEQINVITTGTTALEQQRDTALSRTNDPGRQLAIERQYQVQLLDLKRQGIEANRVLAENAAARQLSDDLFAAKDAGDRRGQLETEARGRYASAIRAIETGARTQTNAEVLALQGRQNEALAKIYQRDVDRTLKGIKDVEGAELVSLQRRLQARLAAAQASGNAPLQQVVQGALDTVTSQMLQNAADFRDRLTQSRQAAADLQDKLADVARSPLQNAERTAASPFNDILKSARTDLSELRKAFGKIAEPTPGQVSDFRSQQATLTRIISSANQERNQAILSADQAFYRARDDKAAEAALKLGKTQFDSEVIGEAAYDRLLDANRQYWTRRLAVAVKGSADEDTANQRLADNQAERDRARQVIVARQADGRTLTREELASQVQLAKTEQERVRARAALVQGDAERLVQVNRELATLKATGGSTEEIRKLERERLTLRGSLNTALDETKQREADSRTFTREQLSGQLAMAKTEAERVRLRAQLVQADSTRLVQVDRELERLHATGGTVEDIRKLEGERLTLQTNLNTAKEESTQRDAESRTFVRDQLVGQLALASTEEERSRLRGEILAGDRARLLTVDAELAGQLALGGPVERIRALKGEQLKLETDINTQQEEQQQRTDKLVASQLSLAAAEGQRQVAMARSNAEVAASKVAAVGQASNDLGDVDGRIAKARADGKAQADINDLLTEREGKLTTLYQAQREAARYGVEVAQQQLDLDEARVRAVAQITGLADDAVASAVIDLDVTQQQIGFIGQQLAKQDELKLTETDINALQVKRLGLIGQEAEQQRKIVEAERQRRDLIEGVNLGAGALQREAAGGSPGNRALSDAEGNVADTRVRLVQATRAYSEAQADLAKNQSTANIQKFASAQEALTSRIAEQRKSVAALASAYRDQLSSMDSVRDATEKLRAAIPGASTDGKIAQGLEGQEYERLYAIQARRDQALKQVQDAIKSGDAKLIASTTQDLTAQQERYNKQAELLKKNGLQFTPSNDRALNDTLKQLDRLGITYDQEAVNLQQRADAADKESQAASTFASATDRLPGIFSVGAAQIQQAIESSMSTRLQVLPVTPTTSAPVSAGVMNTYRGGDTITFNIPITLNGQPVPTPEEFRQIARGELQDIIQNARREKAWNASNCKPGGG